MRKILLLIGLFPFVGLAQQDLIDQQNNLAEAEAKTAASVVNFTANPHTGDYDLKYHRLELNVDPSEAFIEGAVTSYFVPKQNLNQLYFDLANNMQIESVKRNGVNLTYTQNNDELKITLPETLNQGVLDSVTVKYSGNPISSGFGSFEQTEHNGHEIIWTLSEPYGAKAWWPCKQDLNDKIDSLDVFITSPKFNSNGQENIAVSNGIEINETTTNGMKTTHFHHSYPIPAYLIAIAVTNYAVYSHTVPNNGNSFPVVNYVYPENEALAQTQTPITVDIIDLYSSYFTEYPFANEKYGHAQFGWGGGMEHTTVSFMNNFDRQLIAHELGHQWFGDKVTCGSWKDIWLNEGFATYLAAMVIEHFDGEVAFKDWRESIVNQITASPDGAVYLSDEDTTSVGRIFSSRLSYSKGAMVLHMLRKKLGDDDFFQGLRNYLNNDALAYGYAHTQDLKNALENQSQIDLNEFFNDWVYHQGYPSYNLQLHQENDGNVSISLNQTQSNASVSFFEAEVPVRLLGGNGEVFDAILENTENDQQFTLNPGFEVVSVKIDPDINLITANNSGNLLTPSYEENRKVTLYPNPAHSMVSIDKPDAMKIGKLSIVNTLGQVVKEFSYQSSFSIANLPQGMYFVRLQTQKSTIIKTLLVK